MVACGFAMLIIFGLSFYYSTKHQITKPRWLLKMALWGLPLPWIASEAGWFVAEYGRQPWAVGEILPVAVAASSQTVENLLTSLALIISLYTVFIIVETYLMITVVKKGPSSLKTGRYHYEQNTTSLEAKLAQQVQQ